MKTDIFNGVSFSHCYFSCYFSVTVSSYGYTVSVSLISFQLLFELYDISVPVTVILNIKKFYRIQTKCCI